MTHLGLAEKKIRVIYYGCQANEVPRRTQAFREEKRRALPFQPNRKLAIFVGALGDDRKGFETIYAVWEKEAKRADWDLDLLVVGSGAARRWWEEKARAAGVSQHMHFLGFRDDVLEWIGASDVMIHPARYEAYGLGVHEAICSGVPVIVSACAGVAERLQGPLRDLLLERPTDTEELTQKINHWRQQEKDFRQWTEAVGDRWRQQDGEQMARHMVEVCS
jgi:glycosyltransferase involved in cell wall biosynthesis